MKKGGSGRLFPLLRQIVVTIADVQLAAALGVSKGRFIACLH
jgi:hypothetical protein